jgi:type I restriction enzyme, S subunit
MTTQEQHDDLKGEVGRIPENWDVVRFGDVREWLQYGTSIRCGYEPSDFPVLRIPNIEAGRVNLEDLKYGRLGPAEANRYRLNKGDLIFIRTNGVIDRLGSCAVYEGEPKDSLFASYLIRARLKLDLIDPHFAAYFFASEQGTNIIAGRATPAADGKYNLNTATIDNLPLPIPPTLDEQRAIATALKHVQKMIALNDSCASAARDLKHAAIQVLFRRELRSVPQQENGFCPTSESWKLMPISSLGTIVTGTTPPTEDSSNYVGGELQFVAPGDIEHGSRIEHTEKFLTEKGLNRSRKITAGTTCFVCIGSTIGKVGLVTSPICATNQQINSIIPRIDFDPLFVFYLMTYWSDHVRNQASPSPVPILSKGAFEQIEIVATTDLDEQREIAAVLRAIDLKIDLHQKKRSIFEDLFKSLLQQLMSGDMKIADLDLSILASGINEEVAA